MKKFISITLMLLLSLTTAFGMVGCRGGGDDIDPTKTQLVVYTYGGGFGTDWLDDAITRFNQKYGGTSFEEDKVGVQIHPKSDKNSADGWLQTIEDTGYDVIFTEQASLLSAVAGYGTGESKFLPITDIVTENLNKKYGENATIESKLEPQQQSYFKQKGDYYALPHYMAFMGLSYDIDMFEERGYYLLDDGSYTQPAELDDEGNVIDGVFTNGVYTGEGRLSAGPNGKYGDYDDGLPATYAEFFALCNKISRNAAPLVWSGEHSIGNGYWAQFLGSLTADYEGVEQFSLNFSYDSSKLVNGETNPNPYATSLVDTISFDDKGAITNVTFKTGADAQITPATGNRLYGQAGRAYALSFLQQILNNNYYSAKCNLSVSQLNNQLNFLESKFLEGTPTANGGVERRIAMILDNTCFIKESEASFKQQEWRGEQASKENRRIGFMPLPKATPEKVGQGNTLYDFDLTVGAISSAIPEGRIKAAKAFLQFCYTDESLVEFTKITNAPKSLQYDMGSAMDELNDYGKSVFSYVADSEIVYPYSNTPFYVVNQGSLDYKDSWKARATKDERTSIWTPSVNGMLCENVLSHMKDESMTAKNFFEGLSMHYNDSYWNLTYGSSFNG